jgi:hypothetical protein
LRLLPWAFIATLACGATATAQAPRPIVALTFIGNEADRAAFTGSLSELLMRIEIDLGVRETDAPLPKDRLIAIVTADWTEARDVAVQILDAQQKVVLVRRLSRAGSASVTIEAAVHIVQSVIEELAQPTVGQLSPPPALAATVAAPPKVIAPVEPPAEPTSGFSLEVAGFAGGRGYGSSGPPVSPGAGLKIGVTLAGGRWRPSAWVLAEYQAPIDIHPELFDLTVQAIPLRGGIGITAIGQTSWRLDLGLAGGADLFVTTGRSGVLPPINVRRPPLTASPIITGLVALHIAVAHSADVWLGVSLDVDVAPHRWVASIGPERAPVFAPWTVRPAVQLGFSFAAFGPEPFSSRLGGAR